ncbi:MAG: glycosyltransferase [Planctomycetota bacterium]
MTDWQRILLIAYGVIVLIAFIRHFILSHAIRHMTFLSPGSPRMAGSNAPLVSILVPAKDEAHGIERCLRSLLQQDYPNFEILVVDDRSEDGTPEVVARMAAEDSRLRLHQVRELPPGWTGKTHALHFCQRHARGEWLLFVDADTRLDPACVSVVLKDAMDHGAALESLLPSLHAQSFWEKTIQPFAGVCLMVLFPLSKVNQSTNVDMGFANGQFILLRRDAYDAIGGHEGVRDKFVEDIHLGRNARKAGYGLRVVMGRDIASVRMYSSLKEILRGWSRILYSAVDFRPAKLYALLAAVLVFSVLSYAVLLGFGGMLLAGNRTPFVSSMFLLGIAHEILQTTIMARIYALSGSEQKYLAFRFLAVLVMIVILLKTIRMCRTHDVIWRGTSYDKTLLTANVSASAHTMEPDKVDATGQAPAAK